MNTYQYINIISEGVSSQKDIKESTETYKIFLSKYTYYKRCKKR